MEIILTALTAFLGFLTTWYSPSNQKARREKERKQMKEDIIKKVRGGDVDGILDIIQRL